MRFYTKFDAVPSCGDTYAAQTDYMCGGQSWAYRYTQPQFANLVVRNGTNSSPGYSVVHCVCAGVGHSLWPGCRDIRFCVVAHRVDIVCSYRECRMCRNVPACVHGVYPHPVHLHATAFCDQADVNVCVDCSRVLWVVIGGSRKDNFFHEYAISDVALLVGYCVIL